MENELSFDYNEDLYYIYNCDLLNNYDKIEDYRESINEQSETRTNA